MINMKRVLARVTALAVSATIFIPFSDAKAAGKEPAPKQEVYTKLQSTELQRAVQAVKEENDPIASTKKVKREAILGLIRALDTSIDWVVDILKTYNIMDGNTARSFKRNKGVISKALKQWLDVDNIIDTVKKKLPGILRDNGVSKGVAENIAIAVGYLLRVADIFFL
ncbi:hypothetical protein V7417_05245 [Bacillus pumilus]|uniref:hypothetical protein n=1 Tax=Bacillus pumilus TaxID=1408 RepID=UPI002812E712|nr:hypothetical protein [Bacillus pumilus]MDR0123136.1 hypothetical protein [Bacillus pumilus]